METERDDDEFVDELACEEQYVSDVSAELEPIIELVGNWMANEELEPEQSHPNDLYALQDKLRKQEQLIHMLAKASSSLLNVYYNNAKDAKKECNPENERLKEEVMQLTFRNSSLLEQLNELELQLVETDHKVENLLQDNRRLAAASLSTDALTQERLKELQKENNDLNSLISELVSQLKSRERHLANERQKTKKKINLLQESLDSKEAELAKIDKSKMALRKDVKELNERLLAIELEAEELREEMEKNRMKSDLYKFLLEKSELENAECREMLREAKQQLNERNEQQIVRTRIVRHVQNPNSPYVDPDSLACELDKACRDQHRLDLSTSEYGSTTWPDDNGSIPCDDMSLNGLDCDVIDGNTDVYYPMNFQPPLGQPGKPGTYDLDMALDRLSLLQHWKRIFARQMRPALTHTPHVNPRIPRNFQFDCEVSLLSDPLANSSLRSAVSFPMQISFNSAFEGLNNIGRILHSGVLIRGCESADVFEETNYSILDLEEDDEIIAKSDEIDSNHSRKPIAWKDCMSSYSSSGLKILDYQNDIVPTSKSNNGVGYLSGIACSTLQPVQGTIMQRANLGKMTSKPMAQNNPKKLPDCVIS